MINGTLNRPTARETEILNLLVRGQSNKMIGNELEISEQTVKNHITEMFFKFEVKNRTQLAMLASKKGFIKL